MPIKTVSNRHAHDPWRQLAAAVLYQAIVDARRSVGTYRYQAIWFLNTETAQDLAVHLGVEAWPTWTHERAKGALVDRMVYRQRRQRRVRDGQ